MSFSSKLLNGGPNKVWGVQRKIKKFISRARMFIRHLKESTIGSNIGLWIIVNS